MKTKFTISDLDHLIEKGTLRGYEIIGECKKGKRSKYGNRKVVLDGIEFDSKKESRRYVELRMRLRAGEITDLKYHEVFELNVEGAKVCKYEADFTYIENGQLVVEDVKSKATRKLPTYRLKKKLMKAIHNIEIKET